MAHNVRAVKIVWQRELIRFAHDRMRIITSLIQPVLYLFVLGSGLSSLTGISNSGNVSLRTFMFPGVLALSVLFTAMFSAASIVWDREFGFLREMLVAPISRSAIVLGKCLGGATVATFQGVVLIALAGANGVPYDPVLIAELVGLLLALAFAMTAFGVLAAARIRNIQSFMGLTQLFLMPMFFLSGALYPLQGLPAWLVVLTRINPLTYAVDPLRQAVFHHVDAGPLATRFGSGVTWFDWTVPVPLEIVVVLALGGLLLTAAMVQFRRAE
ncbi:MAG TPA: ABC transporter permease [Candidatus Dormibacteraeota bacterium]|nr:ABC transporter permease [Candidatus Dormibacteraeota bacterium]